MRVMYVSVPQWPPLAWVAHGQGARVMVYHGPQVETAAAWWAEAAWPGAFEEGGFDRTELVVGSGGRRRGDMVILVSPGSTVERLHAVMRDGACWVSNSLSALLSMVGGRLECSYPHYSRDLVHLMRGKGPYEGMLRSTVGPVTVVYFDNLIWDGRSLHRVPKPETAPTWQDFQSYRQWLISSLRLLAENMASPTRQHQRYQFVTTISSGYDSPAVTVLVREAGGRDTITLDRGITDAADCGAPIAERLGVRCVVIPREAWRDIPGVEIPFLAGAPTGQEVMFAPAERWLQGRLLCTGMHGDHVWATDAADVDRPLRRPSHEGLALSEARLSLGCLHLPLPFWGARNLQTLRAISRSPEMHPWDLGGDYNRPIPRRMVEEAGVPRELFAQEKRMAHVTLQRPDALTPSTMQAYGAWLRAHRGEWLWRGRVPPVWGPLAAKCRAAFIRHTEWPIPGWWRVRQWGPRRYLFAWAVEQRMQDYPHRPCSTEATTRPNKEHCDAREFPF
jgi:hypothetical protein